MVLLLTACGPPEAPPSVQESENPVATSRAEVAATMTAVPPSPTSFKPVGTATPLELRFPSNFDSLPFDSYEVQSEFSQEIVAGVKLPTRSNRIFDRMADAGISISNVQNRDLIAYRQVEIGGNLWLIGPDQQTCRFLEMGNNEPGFSVPLGVDGYTPGQLKAGYPITPDALTYEGFAVRRYAFDHTMLNPAELERNQVIEGEGDMLIAQGVDGRPVVLQFNFSWIANYDLIRQLEGPHQYNYQFSIRNINNQIKLALPEPCFEIDEFGFPIYPTALTSSDLKGTVKHTLQRNEGYPISLREPDSFYRLLLQQLGWTLEERSRAPGSITFHIARAAKQFNVTIEDDDKDGRISIQFEAVGR